MLWSAYFMQFMYEIRKYEVVIFSQFTLSFYIMHMYTINSEELQEIQNTSIKAAMLALDEGVHDIWVAEDMVTLGEAYTYLFNQEKLKSIESAKILVSLLFLISQNAIFCMPEALRATKTSRISGHSYRKRACHTSSELRAHGGIISVYISRRLQLIVLHNMHRFYAFMA